MTCEPFALMRGNKVLCSGFACSTMIAFGLPELENKMMHYWRDGWWFERRQSDGSVEIGRDAQSYRMLIPAAEWTSIVAAVANGGSSPENHQVAARLHEGGWAAVHYPHQPEGSAPGGPPSDGGSWDGY